MGVRRDDAVSAGVDAGEVLVVAVAGFKDVVPRVVGRVVGAPNPVKDVFAVVCGVGSGGVAGFEAEAIGSHEAGEMSVMG